MPRPRIRERNTAITVVRQPQPRPRPKRVWTMALRVTRTTAASGYAMSAAIKSQDLGIPPLDPSEILPTSNRTAGRNGITAAQIADRIPSEIPDAQARPALSSRNHTAVTAKRVRNPPSQRVSLFRIADATSGISSPSFGQLGRDRSVTIRATIRTTPPATAGRNPPGNAVIKASPARRTAQHTAG